MDTSGSSFNQYITQMDRTNAFILALPQASELRPLLNNTFKEDLKHLAANDLFAKYGTHYLSEFISGGIAEYNSITTKFTGRSQYEIGLDVNASFQRLGYGASAEVSAEAMSENDFQKDYKSSDIYIHGGDENMRDDVMRGKMGNWEKTVNHNPVMIDFTDRSLVPIWELCEDAARRNSLADAYLNYASNYSPFRTQNKYALRVDMCNSFEKRWSDKGSDGDHDVTLFYPQPRAGFNALAGLAVKDYPSAPNQPVITVQPVDSTFEKCLAHPTGFDRLYKDSGTGSDKDGSTWRPVPPAGYVALGDIPMKGHDTKPSKDSVVCVHQSLVSKAVIGDRAWNDHGTDGDKDISFWWTKANNSTSQVPYKAFVTQKGYDKPGNSLAYAIDNSALIG